MQTLRILRGVGFLLASWLILSVSSAAAATPEAQSFAPIKLRGYGTLAGQFQTFSEASHQSVLKIHCQNEPKAQLVLAKYLSDLSLLPGVTPSKLSTSHGPLTSRRIDGQGNILAIRCGQDVLIFVAPDEQGMANLIDNQLPASQKIDASEAEIPVPMYLDRWDKYGFRFYYGPLVKPHEPDGRDVAHYDPKQDFEFAEREGHSGLVVWNSPDGTETADGIMNLASRDWVYRAALERKLPLGINIGLEDGNRPLINRYPADMTPYGPPYLGGWYGALNFGGQTTAWSSAQVQDIALGQLAPLVHDLSHRYDNIVNWLEPHEEMGHGNADWLDDHGPPAAQSFQHFLQLQYKTPDAVAQRWGEKNGYKTWEDVPFPEIATFFGWNSNAFDLTGNWKISYTSPYGPESAGADLDDSKWASIPAPGHAIARVLPRKGAVFRRHFSLDAAWRAAHPRVWLYLWDMNDTRQHQGTPTSHTDVLAFINGHALKEDPPDRSESHHAALEITDALTSGENVITLCLPQAIIDYRAYLSGEVPGVYPALGPAKNAMWADFSDWVTWSRGQAVRRGAQMIRQIDPDRPITLMSPSDYEAPIKAVAEDYGGVFHDTGGMAGFWTDEPCLLMQSSGLPSDCEPGGGALDLDDFKRFMGRWSTENTQGVDYFQHIGDVLWNPQIKAYFEQTQNLWHLMGKYHAPWPEVAVLDSDRNRRLFGFPWNAFDHRSSAPDLILANGYYTWGIQGQLLADYPRATILEDDFARGNADQFRLIIDSNTTIMDEDVVDQIERWVRRGGIFVTFQQTGRHTSVRQDAWPISKLTGYSVLSVDPMAPDGHGLKRRKLNLAFGQTLLSRDAPGWNGVENSAGLSLKKQDPNCQDLLQWEDGTIAAGMRKLGKGAVIHLGIDNPQALLPQILRWAKLKRVPGEVSDRRAILREFISNNGLYDIWVLWNQHREPMQVDLKFRDGYDPQSARDVNTGEAIAISHDGGGASLSNIALDGWHTRAFLIPRAQLAAAPAEWFVLQRSWWKGTADPGPPIRAYQSRITVDLTDDWAFKPLDSAPPAGPPAEELSLADPHLDDSNWPRMPMGILDIPDHPDIHHAIFRKRFTVPAEWNHGHVMLRTHSDDLDGSRKYIDGKPIQAKDSNDTLDGLLTPGSTHLLAREFWSHGPPTGTRTPVWISYQPDPLSRQPLPQTWAFATDYLSYDSEVMLGRSTPSEGALRCVVRIKAAAGQNIVVHARTNDTSLRGLIFNGHWTGANGNVSRGFDINVTPWVKAGEDNEVIIVTGKTTLHEASIDCYEKEQYP